MLPEHGLATFLIAVDSVGLIEEHSRGGIFARQHCLDGHYFGIRNPHKNKNSGRLRHENENDHYCKSSCHIPEGSLAVSRTALV